MWIYQWNWCGAFNLWITCSFVMAGDVNSELITHPWLVGATCWWISNHFPESNQEQYKSTKANRAGLRLNSSLRADLEQIYKWVWGMYLCCSFSKDKWMMLNVITGFSHWAKFTRECFSLQSDIMWNRKRSDTKRAIKRLVIFFFVF